MKVTISDSISLTESMLDSLEKLLKGYSDTEINLTHILGPKKIRCCRFGPSNSICTQYKARSVQAELICIRDARNHGYNSGHMSTGRCGNTCEKPGGGYWD